MGLWCSPEVLEVMSSGHILRIQGREERIQGRKDTCRRTPEASMIGHGKDPAEQATTEKKPGQAQPRQAGPPCKMGGVGTCCTRRGLTTDAALLRAWGTELFA